MNDLQKAIAELSEYLEDGFAQKLSAELKDKKIKGSGWRNIFNVAKGKTWNLEIAKELLKYAKREKVKREKLALEARQLIEDFKALPKS